MVTGVSSGIGYHIVQDLLKLQVEIYGIARRSQYLEKLTAQASLTKASFYPLIVDLSNTQQLQDIFKPIKKIDVIIHNAGFFEGNVIENLDIDVWEYHLKVNLTAPFIVTKQLWPLLKKNASSEGSSIVFISSLAGVAYKEKFSTSSAYTASKMGLVGLSEVLAVEGKPYAIRSNCISPGSVATPMLEKAFPTLSPDFTPRQVSSLALFLASPTSSPLSGSNLVMST